MLHTHQQNIETEEKNIHQKEKERERETEEKKKYITRVSVYSYGNLNWVKSVGARVSTSCCIPHEFNA